MEAEVRAGFAAPVGGMPVPWDAPLHLLEDITCLNAECGGGSTGTLPRPWSGCTPCTTWAGWTGLQPPVGSAM